MKYRCKECKQYFDNYEFGHSNVQMPSVYESTKEIANCPFCDHIFFETYTQWVVRAAQQWA